MTLSALSTVADGDRGVFITFTEPVTGIPNLNCLVVHQAHPTKYSQISPTLVHFFSPSWPLDCTGSAIEVNDELYPGLDGTSDIIAATPLTSQRVRIQNALVSVARVGSYYPVVYDKTTGLGSVLPSAVTPKTVLANETTGVFGAEARNRRELFDQRTAWTFEMILNFDQEVTIEFFEQACLTSPILIGRDNHNGLSQVILHLSRTVATHPVQQSASTGSSFRLVFNAQVGRI